LRAFLPPGCLIIAGEGQTMRIRCMKAGMNHFSLAFILLLFAVATGWSLGQREDEFAYADSLIVNQRYDEAIRYLMTLMKKYPDRFDAAQRQMQRISNIRSAYNIAASELIEVMMNDPMNQEKKLSIIKELESYERNPNPAIKEFVAKTKELSLFTYNQAKFEEIMMQCRTLIDSGKYFEATRIYELGFELYRPEFTDGGFDQTIVEDSFARVSAISEEIARFEKFSIAMDSAFSYLAASFKTDDDIDIDSAWLAARSAALAVSELRRNILEQGRSLQAAFVDIVADNPTITDSSFLPFAFRLVLGRKSDSRLEGIVGAIDSQWISAISKAQSALDEKLTAQFQMAVATFEQAAWFSAAHDFLILEEIQQRGLALLSLWSHIVPSDLIEQSTALGQAALTQKGSDYLQYVHGLRLASSYKTLSLMQNELEKYMVTMDSYQPPQIESGRVMVTTQYEVYRKAFESSASSIEAFKAEQKNQKPLVRSWIEASFGMESLHLDLEILETRIDEALKRAIGLQISAVAKNAAWEYGLLNIKAEKALSMIAEGRQLLDGIEPAEPSVPETKFRYPIKAQNSLAIADSFIRPFLLEIDAFINSYRSRPEFIRSDPSIISWIEKSSSLSLSMSAGLSEVARLINRAREQKRLADFNASEAKLRIAESQAALKSSNFNTAKDRLYLARDRYLTSLELEHNDTLKTESGKVVSEVADLIIKSENEFVITDTRRLLSNGKKHFQKGEYESAESAFLQAKLRWSSTNTLPDFEVEYWLARIKDAMSVRSTRVIPVSSPLFPEASQNLAQARLHFNEGAAFLSKKDKPGAIKAFELSRKYIEEVKSVFPFNQDAYILESRIEQLVDPDKFGSTMAVLFRDAKKAIDYKVDVLSAYNTLTDIQILIPRYPGLKSLLEQAEMLLGLRQAAIESNAVTEVQSLLKEAQRALNSDQPEQRSVALAFLEKAMTMDPMNETACSIKDRLAMLTGGDALLIMPDAAETLYEEALSLFTLGEYRSARTRLDRLLSVYPQGISVKTVAELLVKISARGY